MVNIWYETDIHGQLFAHITADKPFGNAKYIRDNVPNGTLITVPPELKPAITYVLTKHCGFTFIHEVENHDLLVKTE